MNKHSSMKTLHFSRTSQINKQPKQDHTTRLETQRNSTNQNNSKISTYQTIAQKKYKCITSRDHKLDQKGVGLQNVMKDQERSYKQMKSKLMELEERLVKLKNNYESNKKKSKSEKKIGVSGFHKKQSKYNNSNKQNSQFGKSPRTNKSTKELKTYDSTLHYQLGHDQQTNKPISKQQSAKISPMNTLRKNIINKQTLNILHEKSENSQNTLNKFATCQINLKSSAYFQTKQQQEQNGPSLLDEQILSTYITQQNVNQNVKIQKSKHSNSDTYLLRKNQKLTDKSKAYYYEQIAKAMKSSEPSVFEQISKAHFLSSFQFMKNLDINKERYPRPTKKALPQPSKNKTIVLDMDQTLMHCIAKSQKASQSIHSDAKLQICFPDKKKLTIGVNIRPYAKQCIKQLSQHFQLIVFTASHSSYANVVIDFIDPNNQYISHRFYRESCIKTSEGYYVKDLRVIDRDLNNILLVDNAAYSFCIQPENAVPIIPFYDSKADFQLKMLTQYLKQFIGTSNMREKNNEKMMVSSYSRYKNPEEFITALIP